MKMQLFTTKKYEHKKMIYITKNDEFINSVYLTLLERLPDSSGFDSYLLFLDRGKSRADIIYSVMSSDEFHKKLFHWSVVHEKLQKLFGNEIEIFKEYALIIEIISFGKKLPSRQSDLSKLKAERFAYVKNLLINVGSFIPGFGVMLNCSIGSNKVVTEDYFDENNIKFLVGALHVSPKKHGSQFIVSTHAADSLIFNVLADNKPIFNVDLTEADLSKSTSGVSVAIVGRFENTTSIGALSLTFLHHLHSGFNCSLVDTRPDDSRWSTIKKEYSSLKTSQAKVSGVDVAIYTDVFSNSLSDTNYKKVPEAKIKIAYIVFDSTRLPAWWIDSLNIHFDAVITTSKWGKAMIENSGVNIPVFFVPLSLDLDLYDPKLLRADQSKKFRFGCIASFSHRKNIKQLISCFIECFSDQDDVELVVHTPLNYGAVYNELNELLVAKGVKNVIISHEELSEFNYVSLFNSFDVYVLISKGECYSITPRQAMALGKPTIISEGHAHDEMLLSDLFIPVKVLSYEPAYYEAFGGEKIGLQCTYADSSVTEALRIAYYKFTEISKNASNRIAYGKSFSHEKLKYFYTNIICPKNIFLGKSNEILKEGLAVSSKALYQKYLDSKLTQSLSTPNPYKFQKIIVPVHDGGFFSVFNTFLSHFVWNYGREDVAAVIPDWRISTLKKYRSVAKPMSFCYGTENDGNIFTKIFLPIPDMPMLEADYNDDSFLAKNAIYFDNFNEFNEPLLTYVNARELYRSDDFYEWRCRYNRFYTRYFRLKDSVKTDIEQFSESHFKSKFIIGVHIKHPSHAIEQPGGFMPGVTNFIKKILDVVEEKHLTEYQIFLATDQDAVVLTLQSVFGDRVISRNGVVRTSLLDDAAYASLDRSSQLQEGHQIQNLLAADPSRWSVKMAEDVLIDAHLLANCDCFIHVTSNIATAVSYMNPELEMIYCE